MPPVHRYRRWSRGWSGCAPAIGTAFILSALDFARRGGRFNPELLPDIEQDEREGVAVLSGYGSDLEVVALGHSVDELCDQMVECFLAAGRPIRGRRVPG